MTDDESRIDVPARPLTPEARLRPQARGRLDGGTLAIDGADWRLPSGVLARALAPCRDRMFDELTIRGTVSLGDAMEAAWLLLSAAYDLEPGELAGLLRRAEERALAAAATDALFGEDKNHWTYSDWERSALLANGLDPARIDPADLPGVLRQLVMTGRAAEGAAFISSAEAAARKRSLLETLRR